MSWHDWDEIECDGENEQLVCTECGLVVWGSEPGQAPFQPCEHTVADWTGSSDAPAHCWSEELFAELLAVVGDEGGEIEDPETLSVPESLEHSEFVLEHVEALEELAESTYGARLRKYSLPFWEGMFLLLVDAELQRQEM